MTKRLHARLFEDMVLNYKSNADYSKSFIRVINEEYTQFCTDKFENAN